MNALAEREAELRNELLEQQLERDRIVVPPLKFDPANPDIYAFVDEDDIEANLKREHRIRNALHDAMVNRARQICTDTKIDAGGAQVSAAVGTMLATYIEYAIGRPSGMTNPTSSALNTAIDLMRGT
jgi:hypothetical protein